jgi:hypothetical protein
VLASVVESVTAVATLRGTTQVFVARPAETRLVAAIHSYLTSVRDETVDIGRVSSGLQVVPLMNYEQYCLWIISQRRGLSARKSLAKS